MVNKDKKEFGKWWLWVLCLIVLSTVVFMFLNFAGVVGERIVFKNSFQYHEARSTEIATFQAQLAEIQRQLNGNLTPEIRTNLEAQAAGLRVRLETARSK